MKNALFLLFALIGLSAHADNFPANAKEVTYDWLVNRNYVNTPVFKKIFETQKPKVLLEFGAGLPTKYFLDSCTKVLSVEFITNGCGPENFKKFIALYQGLTNWIPIAYFSGWPSDMNWAPYRYLGSDKIYKAASYGNATGKNYASIDNLYLVELGVFLTNLTKSNKVDVAYVNTIGAYPIRGDIVQLLFGKAPLILAPDCNRSGPSESYSYSKIETPDDYEEIFFPISGTTLWISKNEKYAALLTELKSYAPSL